MANAIAKQPLGEDETVVLETNYASIACFFRSAANELESLSNDQSSGVAFENFAAAAQSIYLASVADICIHAKIEDEDFAPLIAFAKQHPEVRDFFRNEVEVNDSTLSRWASGKSTPAQITKKFVISGIRDALVGHNILR